MNLIPEHSRLSTLVVAFLVTLSFAAKSSAREPMAHTYSIVA